MPNHVSTIIKINATGDRLTEIREFLSSTRDDGTPCEFTFDNILPMPEGLSTASSPVRSQYSSEDIDNLVKYGDWYPWNTANRGTKWSAYDIEVQAPDTIYFETAWSHPSEVIKALSLIFRDVSFDVQWADEDTGSNLGAYTIQHGVFTPGDFPAEWTKAARDFAYKVRGLSQEDIDEREEERTADEAEEDAAWRKEQQDNAARSLRGDELGNLMPYIATGRLEDVFRISCWRRNLFADCNRFSEADPDYISKAVKSLMRAGVLTDELKVDDARVKALGLSLDKGNPMNQVLAGLQSA